MFNFGKSNFWAIQSVHNLEPNHSISKTNVGWKKIPYYFVPNVYCLFLILGCLWKYSRSCAFYPHAPTPFFFHIMTSSFSSLSDLDHSKGAGSDGRLFLLALVLKLVLTRSSVAPWEKHTRPGGALVKISDRNWEKLGYFSCVPHTHAHIHSIQRQTCQKRCFFFLVKKDHPETKL